MQTPSLLALVCGLVALGVANALPKPAPGVTLTASSSEVYAGVNDELTLDCRAEGLDDVHMDMIMALFHDDTNGTITPIAKQIVGNTILIVENNSTSAVGDSKGLQDANESYLTVTIADPEVADGGVYSCNFEYFTDEFGRQEYSSSVNVSVIVVPENVTLVFDVPEEENVTCCCCAELKAEIAEMRATLMSENIMLKEHLADRHEHKAAAAAAPVAAGECTASFAARFTGKDGDQYGPQFFQNMPVVFDNVINNRGDAFSGMDGTFVAPCTGQYFFTLALRSYQSYDTGSVEGVITKNGEPQARTYVYYNHDSDNYASSSTAVTLTLEVGDKVGVALETTSTGYLGAAEYSVFSGFYLSA